MKNRFRLAFVVLVIATIVWGIVFYYTLQEYYKFVEGLSEFERTWGLWDPWWRWNGMPYIIITGFCLLYVWVLLTRSYLSSKSKWRARAINVIKRIEGIPVQPGLVVPAELTVAFPKLPTVTFKVVPPPVPEYKPEPEGMPKVGYA